MNGLPYFKATAARSFDPGFAYDCLTYYRFLDGEGTDGSVSPIAGVHTQAALLKFVDVIPKNVTGIHTRRLYRDLYETSFKNGNSGTHFIVSKFIPGGVFVGTSAGDTGTAPVTPASAASPAAALTLEISFLRTVGGHIYKTTENPPA